jgi:hypothetical protein
MTATFRMLGLISLTVIVGGCAKGPLTTQEILQNESYITVDTAQVPEAWLERSVWKRRIGKTHTIRVKPGNRVKVILVPDTGSPTTNPAL